MNRYTKFEAGVSWHGNRRGVNGAMRRKHICCPGILHRLNRRKRRINTVSANLLILFGILMVLGTVFFCTLYLYATATMKEHLLAQMDAQADFYLTTVDRQFLNTKNLLYNMFSDRKLVFLVNDTNLLNDYELREAYLSEQERVQSLKDSNGLISSVSIYLPNTGMLISDMAVRELEKGEFEEALERYEIKSSAMNYHGDEIYMASYGGVFYENGGNPDILFVVTFDGQKICDTLKSFNTLENSGSFFYQREQELFLDSNAGAGVSVQILEALRSENRGLWSSGPEQGQEQEDREQQMQGMPEDKEQEKQDNGTAETVSVEALTPGSISVDHIRYQVSVSDSGFLGYFVQYAPEKEVLKRILPYRYLVLVYLVGMAAAAVLISRTTSRKIHRPLNRLMEAFERAERESLKEGGSEYVGNDEFSYLFDGFNHMQERTRTLVKQVLEQKELTQKAELRQLQAQINPHFLYNSFFLLRSKIRREELEDAERLTLLLGNYYRFLTRDGEELISLEQEAMHARNYVEIQSMRFRDRISVEFGELPDQAKEIRVPRLILQPVVENALKYGLEDREADGLLRVDFLENGELIEIHVEDNGQSFTEEKLKSLQERIEKGEYVTGLVNIHKRLRLYFGESCGIEVGRSRLGGAEVIVKVRAVPEKSQIRTEK